MNGINISIILSVLALSPSANATDLQFCGPGGLILFNSKNVFKFVATTDTCETDKYLANGWLPSANGKCGQNQSKMLFCGQGGVEMQYPSNARWVLSTANTCETDDLMTMGWIQKQ